MRPSSSSGGVCSLLVLQVSFLCCGQEFSASMWAFFYFWRFTADKTSDCNFRFIVLFWIFSGSCDFSGVLNTCQCPAWHFAKFRQLYFSSKDKINLWACNYFGWKCCLCSCFDVIVVNIVLDGSIFMSPLKNVYWLYSNNSIEVARPLEAIPQG